MNRLKLMARATGAVLVCGWLSAGSGRPLRAEEPALKLGAEQVPAGEADDIKKIVALQLAFMKKEDPTKRGQHAKAHGCVEAEFAVRPDIPKEYQFGVFKDAKTYKAKVRFSNALEKKDDRQPDAHGMAIKVLGVKGPRALEGCTREEQDFVLIDREVFFAPDVKTFLAFFEAQAAAAQGDKEAMAKFFKTYPETAKILSGFSSVGQSPLTGSYFSTVPFKLGAGAVKYAAAPVRSENFLREVMVDRLADKKKQAVVFELSIVPQKDPKEMPVEDATKPWASKPVPVATITIGLQEFDTEAQRKECEGLVFDPWHALAEHAPLGGLNRARKAIYPESVKLRTQPTKP